LAVGAALAAAGVSPSLAQSTGANDAARELAMLRAEYQDITQKVRQSAALKEQSQQQLREVEEQEALLKTAWDAIEVMRPNVRKLCSGKVAPEKLAEAKAKCDGALAPFNKHVQDYNEKKQRVDARRQTLQQEDAERVAATERLEAHGEQVKQRISVLEVALSGRPSLAATSPQPSGQPAGDQVGSLGRTARPTPQQTILDHFGRIQGNGAIKPN